MRSFPKIKQNCKTVFTTQLSLVNLAVMGIIMNYMPKSNGKDNCLKSRFSLSCKNDEMSLRPFWHNTVDMITKQCWMQMSCLTWHRIESTFWKCHAPHDIGKVTDRLWWVAHLNKMLTFGFHYHLNYSKLTWICYFWVTHYWAATVEKLFTICYDRMALYNFDFILKFTILCYCVPISYCSRNKYWSDKWRCA